MTDAKFKELVNLYLDKEISERELAQLKDALANDAKRRREFEELRRLHQAMLLALGSSLDATGPRGEPPKVVRMRRWATGFAAAASFAVGGAVALAFLPDSGDDAAVAAAEERVDALPGDVSRADIRRYEAYRESDSREGLSLAAQLRLSGLSPDLMPAERELQAVDSSALQARDDRSQRIAELFERLEKSSSIPAVRLIEEESPSTEASRARWPNGFQSSLASFR